MQAPGAQGAAWPVCGEKAALLVSAADTASSQASAGATPTSSSVFRPPGPGLLGQSLQLEAEKPVASAITHSVCTQPPPGVLCAEWGQKWGEGQYRGHTIFFQRET